MKKKPQDPETVLERAGELFERGNYLLALREFEKVVNVVHQDEIIDKIKICKKEIEQLRLKDLIKRGKKHTGKKNYRNALQCFEEAYAISGEDWLIERIDQLKEHLYYRDSFHAAGAAEAAGEFEKAADLYGQALAAQVKEEIIIKRARCLIRAGKNSDAVSALKDLPSTLSERELDQRSRYDYGFVLAGAGRYYECLKVWDSIESNDNDFLEQKESVRTLLATDLYERFYSGGDYTRIFEEAKYLQDSSGRDSVEDLVSYCKYARIEQLWKDEQYETIRELLLPYPEKMDANLLALYAKTYFKLAEASAEHLSEFMMFWLSAIYDHDISEKFSSQAEVRDDVRKVLIRKAEELIKRYDNAGDLSSEKILACWNVEKKLIEDLHALVGRRRDLFHLVRTPSFVEALGLTSQILSLVKNNRDFFYDQEHYLLTGAYYSSGAKSLLYLERGEYEKAMTALPGLSDSEFTDYCSEKVRFACGIYCLEQGKANPDRYFKTSASLFEKASRYEQELIDKALDAHKLDELSLYEKILSGIHSIRPTRGIADALSLVMIRRSIISYNTDQINPKILNSIAEKALSLNPENDLAQNTLNDAQVGLEIEELFNAMNKYSMDKAIRIAVKSEHQQVRESFFEFMNDILQSMERTVKDREKKILMLKDMYQWGARVDELHPILNDIDRRIQILELG